MGLFDVFKKKRSPLTPEEKLDALWERWEKGKAKSPCAELMTYQSEINNGGHDQYFFNVSNTGNLKKELSLLEQVLPETHKANLKRAYEFFLILEENEDDEAATAALEQCDDVFYEHEQEINRLLEECAAKTDL